MSYQQSFERLKNTLNELREHCPWDKKQTIHTLRILTLEETYELTDAILEEDWQGMKEELGDVLLHLIFYSKIAEEQGQFTIHDVIEQLCNKLVQRHPHIYANLKVDDEKDVKKNWEKIKQATNKKSLLAGVPKGLPALVKAVRLQEKTAQVGFEWEHVDQVKEKVDEELGELADAVKRQEQKDIEDEFGDVLFAMINYARFLKIDPERALERTNQKFQRRFQQMEDIAESRGQQLNGMSLTEQDQLWNEVKKQE